MLYALLIDNEPNWNDALHPWFANRNVQLAHLNPSQIWPTLDVFRQQELQLFDILNPYLFNVDFVIVNLNLFSDQDGSGYIILNMLKEKSPLLPRLAISAIHGESKIVELYSDYKVKHVVLKQIYVNGLEMYARTFLMPQTNAKAKCIECIKLGELEAAIIELLKFDVKLGITLQHQLQILNRKLRLNTIEASLYEVKRNQIIEIIIDTCSDSEILI